MQNYPEELVLFLQIWFLCVNNYFKFLFCGCVSQISHCSNKCPRETDNLKEEEFTSCSLVQRVCLWLSDSTAGDLIRQSIKAVNLRLFLLELR